MIKFNVEKRWSSDIAFTAEIDCAEDAPLSFKLRLSVFWAIKNNADLSDANLSDADLSGADLSDADLSASVIRHFKHDLWGILMQYQSEIGGLKKAIREGKINGSVYSGDCACLMGTIANVKKCDVNSLIKDATSPAECWFLQMKEGHTPKNNGVSKMTLEWIEEFERLIGTDIKKEIE